MSHAVPRLGRLLDVAGLLLVVGGAASYLYAYAGLERIRTGETVITGTMFATLNETSAYSRISDIGMALAVAGVLTFVAAFAVTRRARQSPGSA